MSFHEKHENENKSPYETLFDLNAPKTESLDEEKVRFSLYNDINPEKSKEGDDEEWNLRMTCIMEWFIRCSWINKFLFIDKLCHVTIGCTVLEDVLRTIQPIFTKDLLESLSRDPTNFCYDRIPIDDNRALESSELNVAIRNALSWYLSLDPNQQVRVILKLLRLGGGGLIYRIYKSVEKYRSERQEVKPFKSFKSLKSISTHTVDTLPPNDSKISSKVSIHSSKERESARLREISAKKEMEMERRNHEIQNYKKLRGILEDESKKEKKGDAEETVDYLQILPIWLNRRIMSYIDDKTLAGFKKVGKYWGKMIDESINEKSGRKAINAKINRMIGIKADKEEKKKKDEEEEDEFLVEMGPKDLINRTKEVEAVLRSKSEFYGNLFSRKCSIKTLDTSYHPERCGAYDSVIGTIASSNPYKIVHFYSSRTGARFGFMLFGMESPVTSLSLHEDRIHVFIGCKDGSLICKNMRTNRTTCTFHGHSDAVFTIFTTSQTVLSSSLDNTIKYFRLWSGVCLLCINLNPELHITSALQRNDKPSIVAIGTQEGWVVLVDLELKKLLIKVRLHKDRVTQLAHDEEILITGSEDGKVRIWNMNYLKNSVDILRPYYNIDVGSSITSFKVFKNQIFSGCENGTLKIISLTTGKVFKTLKISSLSPITGVDISEDKLFLRLIIWHEKGIEIRTFSLQKSSSKKISKEKDNQKCKQKAPKKTKKNKMSEMDLWEEAIRGKRTTFAESRKPLEERCCTLPVVRTKLKTGFTTTGILTEAYSLYCDEPIDRFLQAEYFTGVACVIIPDINKYIKKKF